MIDLNHILLFIAIVSPLILLARIARLRNPRNRGWRIAALLVLGVSVLAWVFLPSLAGFIGGTFWCLLLVVPSVAEQKIDQALSARRFARARRLAGVRRILHPWEDSPHRPSLFRALELAGEGRFDLALDRLAQERTETTPGGRFAIALSFALTENWPGLLQWCRRDFAVTTNPAVFSLYLRALGETGALDELVRQLAAHAGEREGWMAIDSVSPCNLAIALAFCGRTKDFLRLIDQDSGQMLPAPQEFWRATAELAEGKTRLAVGRLEKLRVAAPDGLLRRSSERRLNRPGRVEPLSAASEMLLDHLVAETVSRRGTRVRRGLRDAPAVWALILCNLVAFGWEMVLGGSTNSRTLEYLGALEPAAVVLRHESWRLWSAMFLHYGVLHLAINLFALAILGPPLERLIGSAKFVGGYLLSGLGSNVGVVLLSVMGLTSATQLVGASGAIMGVIGISAGLLLRHRQSPLVGRQLQNILVIVAIQTAFDLWTPQVSLAAHLGGFLSGVPLGLIFASFDRREAVS